MGGGREGCNESSSGGVGGDNLIFCGGYSAIITFTYNYVRGFN